MPDRVLFIAGSTGAVGRTVVRLAAARGVRHVAHTRPKPDRPPSPESFDLGDHAALVAALRECTTVVQLIGTMRKRFATGDTYQTSDIGTTQKLVTAAREAGSIDHVVLLSSVGAGKPRGAYLQAKAQAETLVRDSGVPYTTFRPSAFMGEGHRAPPGAQALTRLLGLDRFRPIAVEDLARAILHVAVERAPLDTVLEGESLWRVVEASR